MTIKKYTGTITNVADLSSTAKEITLSLSEPMAFEPGSFVNLFLESAGEKIRRAFSISSSREHTSSITLTVRLVLGGKMTPFFWQKDRTGDPIEIVGPLGVNTADKLKQKCIFLFGFGVGAGVIKSLAAHFATKPGLESLVVMTGSRNENEVLYQSYFENLARQTKSMETSFVISQPTTARPCKRGYLQDHIDDYVFDNADIYICGQTIACEDLKNKIQSKNPKNCSFFIEAFHT